jgi:hypothetical protein
VKKFYISLAFTFFIVTCSACDICGCSAGDYFIGPYPQFNKHFIGLRYSFRNYFSRVAEEPTEFSKDFYQTIELWGGMKLGKKWQLTGFMPYNINRQHSDDGKRRSNAIGDITLIANYTVLNIANSTTNKKLLTHRLLIGGGVKLPTGKFNADPDEIIPDANNQPGTGSVDYLVNAMYSFHKSNWGINSNVTYKVNGSSSSFHFGNRLNVSSYFFKTFNCKSTAFNPNVGVTFENLNSNQLDKVGIASTGGSVMLAAAGLEMGIKRMIIGVNVQQPFIQDLSAGQTTAKTRGMLHVTYVF